MRFDSCASDQAMSACIWALALSKPLLSTLPLLRYALGRWLLVFAFDWPLSTNRPALLVVAGALVPSRTRGGPARPG